jgi:hypothetical protein
MSSKNPPKPRKFKYETKNEHHQQEIEWKTFWSHDSKIKSKENAMTQAYCTKRLSSVYARSINEARFYEDRMCILQEDNDLSNETRLKDNVVTRFKAINWIDMLLHPSQSSNLSLYEVVLNILKRRVKRKKWRTIAQLKQMILDEWDRITMNEIRVRIREMPERCKRLIKQVINL